MHPAKKDSTVRNREFDPVFLNFEFFFDCGFFLSCTFTRKLLLANLMRAIAYLSIAHSKNENLLLLDDPSRVKSQITSVVCQTQRFACVFKKRTVDITSIFWCRAGGAGAQPCALSTLACHLYLLEPPRPLAGRAAAPALSLVQGLPSAARQPWIGRGVWGV